LAIQLGLAAEVVVQIGLRQPGGIGDGGHRRAVEAGAREHLLRRTENPLAVGGANLALRAHGATLSTRAPAANPFSRSDGAGLCTRAALRLHFLVAASHTAWLYAAAPGSFLITGELPPVSSTLTVRS